MSFNSCAVNLLVGILALGIVLNALKAKNSLIVRTWVQIFPGGSDGKASAYNAGRPRFSPWVGKIPWRRKWQPTPVLLPGKSHGRRLADYPHTKLIKVVTSKMAMVCLHLHFMMIVLVAVRKWIGGG